MSDARYTSGSYLADNPGWHVEDSAWKAEHIARLLTDQGIMPRTVVDVGCGAGEVLARLQPALPAGCDLVGYDIAPRAIARSQTKANTHLRFVIGDFLLHAAARVDLALAVDVFEHIEDYIGFLRHLVPRARHFIFHIPLDLHVSSLLRVAPLLDARRQVGHLHFFTRELALAALADAGYRVIAERYTPGALDLQTASVRTRIARLPRRVLFSLSPHFAVRCLGGFSLLVLAEPATPV
jgi:SAM-dependent methyltransferase